MSGGDGARSLAGRSAQELAAATKRRGVLGYSCGLDRRDTRRGQSTVEFAIVAPLFFFLFFTVISGGIFLFSRGSIQHAANEGSVQWAIQGSNSVADADAFTAMDSGGLDNTLLTTVTEVTLQEESQSPTTGALSPAMNCGTSGTLLCEDVYERSVGSTTLTPIAGWITPTDNWPPAVRADSENGEGGGLGDPPSFARLTIYYKYATIGNVASFSLTADVVFRLEPQSL
jgi:Flp pilus assembly protein TadG